MKIKLLFFFSLFLFAVCTGNTQESMKKKKDTPQNLEEAIAYLKSATKKKELEEFRNMDEESATIELHHGTGTWIRNTWIRGAEDKSLVEYFGNMGITHPDDISSIILTSLHRHLNGKNIDVEGQAKYYKKYWEKIKKESKDRK